MPDPALVAFLDSLSTAIATYRSAIVGRVGSDPDSALDRYGATYLEQFRIPPTGAVRKADGWDLTGDGFGDYPVHPDVDLVTVPLDTLRVYGGFNLDGPVGAVPFPTAWLQADEDVLGIPPAGAVRVSGGWDTDADSVADIADTTSHAATVIPTGGAYLGAGGFDTDADSVADTFLYWPARDG